MDTQATDTHATANSSRADAARLAAGLRAHRLEVAQAFAAAIAPTAKWSALTPPVGSDTAERREFLETYFVVLADYLAQYFERGDDTYRYLFVGEQIKNLYDATLDEAPARAQAFAVCVEQSKLLDRLLRPVLTERSWQLLAQALSEAQRLLVAPAGRTQRVLFVGDCLFLDVVPFIVGELLDAGIALVPDYATSKSPPVLRDELRKFSAKKYDVVFFSPFSYEFALEYAQLADWRRSLRSEAEICDVVKSAWNDTRETLDLLADLYDCPIHVHNSAAIMREESPARRRFKLAVTARVRVAARGQINTLLREHVERKNAESFRHLHVLDEAHIVSTAGEFHAGAFFYRSPLQHPAVMGRILARRYADILYVNAWLANRKLVVSDLDNTLWHGVIGEGTVDHYHDRQAVLKGLRRKGVVLAINSKNDPANVHWRGGTLDAADFVCTAISWDTKVQGIRRIQTALNLKMKDYVFIDDREDERELVALTYPDILCLDATNPATWRRIELWRELLEDDLEMDRTLMYQQREQRKAFVREELSSDEERASLFTALQLRLLIRQAKTDDLRRVAELINRTNQFNLEGSRTSFTEVCKWHGSSEHMIFVGQTSDRFGDMGATCVVVSRVADGRLELLPFVLSCRVFGYGIERAMLNYLKRVAAQRGLRRIVGRIVETPHNAPCRTFLADNGFHAEGGLWIFDIGDASPPDALWLHVDVVTADGGGR
jgi:FkbH-like protein